MDSAARRTPGRRLARVGAGMTPVVLAWALLASPSTAGGQEHRPESPRATLAHRGGRPDPGGSVQVQVEVRWPGRPERHLPGRPSVDLPEGAQARQGETSSRFDGEQTRWWTDLQVELPERGGPWKLGPARIPIVAGPLAGTELRAEAIEVGEPSVIKKLLGQAFGSGLVIGAVLLWLGWRWRSLAPAPVSEARARAAALLALAAGQAPRDCLATLLLARRALADLGAPAEMPPLACDIEQRLDAIRFGGESIGAPECRELLARLEAATKEME